MDQLKDYKAYERERKQAEKKDVIKRKSLFLTAALLGSQYKIHNLADSGTTDCVLVSKVDHAEFNVHRTLICDWLPVPSTEVVCLDLSRTAIELLLHICYYQVLESTDAVYELGAYAESAKADDLLIHTLNNYYSQLPVMGVFWAWLVARKYNLDCLKRLKQSVGDNNWVILDGLPGVEYFLRAPLEAVLDLATDDNVSWRDGERLTDILLTWCVSNVAVAVANCRRIVSTIRFESFEERRRCLKKIRQAFGKELGMDEAAVLLQTSVYSSIKPRVPNEVLLFFGGWNNRKGSANVLFFDVINNHWASSEALKLPLRVAYHKVFQINRHIYCFGGYDYANFLTNVWRFDFEKMSWEARCPLPDNRGYFGALEIDSQVYIFGGYDFLNRLATNHVFDPVKNAWNPFPVLSGGRSDAAVVFYQGKILVSGGFDGERTLSKNECIDPKKPEEGWQAFPPLRQPRSGHSLVVSGDILYAIGGFQHGNSTDSCEFFDPVNNEWRVAPSMEAERSTFSAIAFGRWIFAIGGHAMDTTTAIVEKFDGRKWYRGHSLPKAMAAGATILYKDPFYIEKIINNAS